MTLFEKAIKYILENKSMLSTDTIQHMLKKTGYDIEWEYYFLNQSLILIQTTFSSYIKDIYKE